jgi:hypothetical protein
VSGLSGGAALYLSSQTRHCVTGPGSVVGVSVHGAVEVGAESISEDYTSLDGAGGSSVSHGSSTSWAVGAFGGLALDRTLIDQLSLRLAVQLLSIGYTKTTTSPSETVQGAGSSFNASLIFSPSLELRLAF